MEMCPEIIKWLGSKFIFENIGIVTVEGKNIKVNISLYPLSTVNDGGFCLIIFPLINY